VRLCLVHDDKSSRGEPSSLSGGILHTVLRKMTKA
jgi:hypothetical protein